MKKRVRKAEIGLCFPYPDMGDEYVRKSMKGPQGEDIVFDVSKGAGSVAVDVYVDYGEAGSTNDTSYFEKMFDEVVRKLDDDVSRTKIYYTYI